MNKKAFSNIIGRLAEALSFHSGILKGEAWHKIGETVNRSADAARRWSYEAPNIVDRQTQIALGKLIYHNTELGTGLVEALFEACNGSGIVETKKEFVREVTGNKQEDDYIEREIDRICLKYLQKNYGNITIKGSRQTGKSRLVNRLKSILDKQNNKVVVFHDFLQFGQSSKESLDTFLRKFCHQTTKQLHISNVKDMWKSYSDDHSPESKYTEFFEDVVLGFLNDSQSLVMFIDAGDAILNQDFRVDFFSLLRSWINSQSLFNSIWKRFFLVITISTEPYLLIPDIKQSPFNIGMDRRLTDFSLIEVAQFNQTKGLPFTQEQLNNLYALTNGHPLLTNIAFTEVVDYGKSPEGLLTEALEPHSPFRAHLNHMRQILSDKPELVASLKEIARHQRCSNQEHIFPLRGAGLITEGTGKIAFIRCQLYADYLGLFE